MPFSALALVDTLLAQHNILLDTYPTQCNALLNTYLTLHNTLLGTRLTRHNAILNTWATWQSLCLTLILLNTPYSFVTDSPIGDSSSKDSNSTSLAILLFFILKLTLEDTKSISRANISDEELVGTFCHGHMQREVLTL
ncbi:hypothetical protein VNO78_12255 [Psophocarpus tetragonolobus]|uniref:Uncharacterized protein n=1 Tax=Psophocarpus tetragonolobus TaxID=3891 RepID=A0AAN9XP40_PSOTE